jgi:hypothetical protein
MACTDPTGPTRTLLNDGAVAAVTPHPIDFINGGTYPTNLADGVVRLCKSSNATGSFEFTWSLNGGGTGAIPGGPLVVSNPAVPACRTIYTSAVDNDQVETIVITEAADQTNWALTGRSIDQYFGQQTAYPAPRLSDADNTGARSVTVYINNDMAKLATFTNTFTAPPSTGCTYTKGWSQNKNGAPTVISVDGRSISEAQAIFAATPGKPNGVTWGSDNLLLNLYQQLLAALNNLGGDANEDNGPAAVDTAIDDAQNGTNGSGLNITTTLTHTQMSNIVSVLAGFNEGDFTGWPHCDD